MKSKNIVLDRKDKLYLEHVRDDKYGNNRKKRKAKVILSKAKKKSIKEIQKETGLSKRTIISYTNDYIKYKKFFVQQYRYKRSRLYNNPDIIHYFKENIPKSYREASKIISKNFNINISPNATRLFLEKHKIYTERTIKYPKIKTID